MDLICRDFLFFHIFFFKQSCRTHRSIRAVAAAPLLLLSSLQHRSCRNYAPLTGLSDLTAAATTRTHTHKEEREKEGGKKERKRIKDEARRRRDNFDGAN